MKPIHPNKFLSLAYLLLLSIHMLISISFPSYAEPRYPLIINIACATKAAFKPIKGSSAVAQAFAKHKEDGVAAWGDSAVKVVLHNRKDPVYFVPLSCGATCNCMWLLVDSTGTKSLGVIGACIIQIEPSVLEWPRLICYSHEGAETGTLSVYEYEAGEYVSKCSISLVGGATAFWEKCIDQKNSCP